MGKHLKKTCSTNVALVLGIHILCCQVLARKAAQANMHGGGGTDQSFLLLALTLFG